jgi:DNA polymerase-1
MVEARRTLLTNIPPRLVGSRKREIKNREVVYGCALCGLDKLCHSPKMNGFGNFKKEVMVIAEAPGENEDKQGKPLVGRSGDIVSNALTSLGWSLTDDTYRTNVVRCRPPNNVLGANKLRKVRIESCKKYWEEEVNILNPKVIIVLGDAALEAITGRSGMRRYRGFMIPSKKYNCIICPTYHPAYFMHGGEGVFDIWYNDLHRFLTEGLDKYDRLNSYIDWHVDKKNIVCTEYKDAFEMLKLLNEQKCLSVDFETNGLKPYLLEDPKVLCVSFTTIPDYTSICIPIDKGTYWTENEKAQLKWSIGGILNNDNVGKVIQNVQFEGMWDEIYFGTQLNNVITDTMIDSHLLESRPTKDKKGGKSKGVTSLDFQVYVNYGLDYKDMVDHANLEYAPDSTLFEYNNLDSKYTMKLYQDRIERVKPMQFASELFKEGQLVFPRWEAKGVRIDLVELDRQDKALLDEMQSVKNKIFESEAVQQFIAEYKREPEIGDNATKGDVKTLLFNIMKLPILQRTDGGNASLTEEVLHEYAKTFPFCSDLVELRKVSHHRSTYITGVREGLTNGRAHPSANLHLVGTHRSSYDNPNLQNFPKRSERFKEVRKIILPDEGHIIGEADYSGMEVRVAAMESKDPVLVDYLRSGYDMHADWTEKVFKIKKGDPDFGKLRSLTKNMFVFPEFYGSYYVNIGADLAQIPEFRKLFLNNSGVYIQDEALVHLKYCEDEFWNTFKVFKRWKEGRINFYELNGYIPTLFGFRRYAPLNRNMIINSPIQGHAFHLLLYSIIEIENSKEWQKLNSRLMFEVHDALVLSIDPEEKDVVVDFVTDKMCNLKFDFVNVPLEVEWVFSTLENPSWYHAE